jgi:hypothetical protein
LLLLGVPAGQLLLLLELLLPSVGLLSPVLCLLQRL